MTLPSEMFSRVQAQENAVNNGTLVGECREDKWHSSVPDNCLLFGIHCCGHHSANRVWLYRVLYSLCRRRKKAGKRGVILVKA